MKQKHSQGITLYYIDVYVINFLLKHNDIFKYTYIYMTEIHTSGNYN